MTEKTIQTPIDINVIRDILPHRFPFLLVDRVLDYTLTPEKTLTAIKNVSMNEPFFTGHFPGNPVMPGVLVLEAMAQACGILAFLSHASPEQGNMNYLVKIDKAKFTRKVIPGDQLLMQVSQQRIRQNMGFYTCETTVNGERTARCEIISAGG